MDYRGGDILFDREVIQKLFHLLCAHLRRVALLMKEDVTLYPVR